MKAKYWRRNLCFHEMNKNPFTLIHVRMMKCKYTKYLCMAWRCSCLTLFSMHRTSLDSLHLSLASFDPRPYLIESTRISCFLPLSFESRMSRMQGHFPGLALPKKIYMHEPSFPYEIIGLFITFKFSREGKLIKFSRPAATCTLRTLIAIRKMRILAPKWPICLEGKSRRMQSGPDKCDSGGN